MPAPPPGSDLPSATATPEPARTATLDTIFDGIYAADLVYEAGCWQRCGDAHCCSFQRYKSRFRMMARTPFQELPLLPGEYRYLQDRGLHRQFGDHEHRVVEFPLDRRVLKAESVISRRTGCACDHGTRTTVCRLYPLLPRFDDDGRLTGVERLGIYEELEAIGGLPSACRLDALPFEQFGPFLAITSAIGASPLLRLHLEAYRLTKAHVAGRIAGRVAAKQTARSTGQSMEGQPMDIVTPAPRAAVDDREPFATFEAGFLRRNLVDTDALRAELDALARRYDARFPGWDAPAMDARGRDPRSQDARGQDARGQDARPLV